MQNLSVAFFEVYFVGLLRPKWRHILINRVFDKDYMWRDFLFGTIFTLILQSATGGVSGHCISDFETPIFE